MQPGMAPEQPFPGRPRGGREWRLDKKVIKILEKPGDVNEAYKMISSLSGQTHIVHTAVVIFSNGQIDVTGGLAVGPLIKIKSIIYWDTLRDNCYLPQEG